MRKLAVLLVPLLATGCEQQRADIEPPKPPAVEVCLPVTREVTDYEDFTGRTEAVAAVEIRARATGYLDKILFTDGAMVKAGDPLFEIDPRPYAAELAKAQAEVLQEEASLDRLDADLRRSTALLSQRSISRETYDKISADRRQAAAMVESAKAELAMARLNLDYTRVIAPISGRVSRRAVDIGNLVEANKTLLTSIVAVDPMNINFDVDERTVLRLRRLIDKGKIESAQESRIPFKFELADEKDFPNQGSIDFLDNKVDSGTGTQRMRGVFDNPTQFFSPGLFVRVRLFVGKPRSAILVPEEAVGTDQGLKFLYVVDGKDEVVYRRVEIGSLNDGMRVIASALTTEERVIVNGLQRARPGAKVTPLLEATKAQVVGGGALRAAIHHAERRGALRLVQGSAWDAWERGRGER